MNRFFVYSHFPFTNIIRLLHIWQWIWRTVNEFISMQQIPLNALKIHQRQHWPVSFWFTKTICVHVRYFIRRCRIITLRISTSKARRSSSWSSGCSFSWSAWPYLYSSSEKCFHLQLLLANVKWPDISRVACQELCLKMIRTLCSRHCFPILKTDRQMEQIQGWQIRRNFGSSLHTFRESPFSLKWRDIEPGFGLDGMHILLHVRQVVSQVRNAKLGINEAFEWELKREREYAY